MIYAGWPEGEKYATPDAMRHMVDVYNETAAFLAERSLQFGLHNHWWEFEAHDGYYPFYYLLEHLDKKIFFEIDTYWARTGGMDPAKVVTDFGVRAPLLHIKDGPAVKGDVAYKQVPAGEGVMDFATIVKAGGKNTQWMIVEFDGSALASGMYFSRVQAGSFIETKKLFTVRCHVHLGRMSIWHGCNSL